MVHIYRDESIQSESREPNLPDFGKWTSVTCTYALNFIKTSQTWLPQTAVPAVQIMNRLLNFGRQIHVHFWMADSAQVQQGPYGLI